MPRPLIPLLALLLVAPAAPGQGVDAVRAAYTKYEYRIPMRDGVKLFTAVYVPKDDSRPRPILLNRTPYAAAPYGPDHPRADLGPSTHFFKANYVFAYQDVRGRNKSGGEYVHVRPLLADPKLGGVDESTDAYDTVEWLVKNVPNNSGKVGLWGISYPGFYAACGMLNAHPALAAASPQAPVADWFAGDDWHHNGAFFLNHAFRFMDRFEKIRPENLKKIDALRYDMGTPDAYDYFLRLGPTRNAAPVVAKENPFWNELTRHGDYDDWWKARDLRRHLTNVKPAVLTVGGWFDAENLFGALEVFKRVEASGGSRAGSHLVMGPWWHGQWAKDDGSKLGDVSFHAKTAEHYREKIEFAFFEYHLAGAGDGRFPKAWAFETGTNRWRTFDQWPPKATRRDFFLTDGQLADRPLGGWSEFVSDPAKPVPYLGRPSAVMAVDYPVADQRFAASRPDVLTFETPPLEDDLTVAGPVGVDLTVTTTGTDADWVVKLIDVYPGDQPEPEPNPANVRMGGYQQLVRGDVMRGKYRDGLDKPTPFEPGKPTPVRFELPDTLHTFRAGHRLMVQVQSSWFPLVDRNPQTFCDIYAAGPEAFTKATHRVGRGSRVTVGVLK